MKVVVLGEERDGISKVVFLRHNNLHLDLKSSQSIKSIREKIICKNIESFDN